MTPAAPDQTLSPSVHELQRGFGRIGTEIGQPLPSGTRQRLSFGTNETEWIGTKGIDVLD